MAKQVIAQKLILDLGSEGSYNRGTLLYRISDGGALSPSKSVKVTLNEEATNEIINEAVESAKTSEGIV